MVVTIDCRDTINCKVTIVLCNGALSLMYFMLHIVIISLSFPLCPMSVAGGGREETERERAGAAAALLRPHV